MSGNGMRAGITKGSNYYRKEAMKLAKELKLEREINRNLANNNHELQKELSIYKEKWLDTLELLAEVAIELDKKQMYDIDFDGWEDV